MSDVLTRLPGPEQDRRAELVRVVRARIEAAGGSGRAEFRAAQEAWVRGEISLEEIMDRAQR